MTARLLPVAPGFQGATGVDPPPSAALAMQLFGPLIVDGFTHSNGVGWSFGVSDLRRRIALASGVSQSGIFSPRFDGSATGWSDDPTAISNAYPPPAVGPRREAVSSLHFADRHTTSNVGDVWDNCGVEFARDSAAVELPVLHLGSRTDVAVESFMLRSTPGLQSVTGLGFQPDVVILIGAGRFASHGGCSFEVGAFDADGNQWAVAERSVYGSGQTFLGGILDQVVRMSRFVTDACLYHIGTQENFGPTSVTQRAEASSMDADGFTINVTDAGLDSSGNPSRCIYLAARLVGGQAAVGFGVQDDLGIPVGFQPDAMLFFSNLSDDETEQSYAALQMGMCDETQQRGMWGGAASGSPGGLPPPSEGAASSSYALYNAAAHGSVVPVPGGAEITWDLTDSFPRLFGWVAFLSDDAPALNPSATTELADAHCDHATLYGTVQPGGGVAQVFFDFGPTAAYGTVIPAGTISGAPDLVAVTVGGLAEGGTYHFRIRILVDGVCTFVGDDFPFTVGPCGRGLRVITQESSDPSYSTPDLTLAQ